MSSHVRVGSLAVDALRFAAVAVAYGVSARAAQSFGAVGGVATVVGPASGIALVAVLAWGPRMLPAVALGALFANLAAELPLATSAALSVGDTVQPWLAARVLERAAPAHGVRGAWGTGQQVFALGAAAVVGALVTASIGCIAGYLGGFALTAPLPIVWRSWWAGDALGMLLLTPLWLTWPALRRGPWPRARALEAFTTLALVAVVAVFAFGFEPAPALGARAYFVFPPLLWATARFRQLGAATTTIIIGAIATWGTLGLRGPFASFSVYDSELALQTFIGVTAITALSFGAVNAARFEAASALARENAFTAAVLDSAGLLVVLDPRGVIVRCNAACARLLGTMARPGGGFVQVLAGAEQRENAERTLLDAIDARQTAVFETRCRTDLGERVILWSAAVLTDDEGAVEHVIVSGNDLTDRRRLEAQLVAADRLSAMGTLAAGVGHEINNPLAYTMMSIELARKVARRNRERIPSDALELEQLLDTAFEGSERVRRIVGDLKNLARSGDEAIGAVDVQRVLEACIPLASNEIRHRARLVRDFQPVPLVDADEGKLGQVFLNLLLNAAQAIPEGHAMRHEIRVTTRRDERGHAVIEVSDTGVGIDPLHMSRLFEPFFTTREMGVGLGLSVSHAIVTRYGGELDVQSELGYGTTVLTTFPPSGAAHERAAEQVAAPAPSEPLHILIVDDEREVARALKLVLSDHRVELAASGREALALCLRNEYDLVLCDLLMPELTGMDVYEALRERRPGYEQRFVFMTGGAFTRRASDFLATVDNPRLEKPFSGDALLALIDARTHVRSTPVSGPAPAPGAHEQPGETREPRQRRRSAGI